MLNFLESKLYSDVEGTCSGKFGYIIAVVSILDIGKGMVISGTGQAEFITRYRAIVFKPFKGEVVDGVVASVTKVCTSIHCMCSVPNTHQDTHRWAFSRTLDHYQSSFLTKSLFSTNTRCSRIHHGLSLVDSS